jgi:hypothetical protein
MQTQDFAPAAGTTRTILLGRNRLNSLAASFAPAVTKVKSFDNRTPAPRPSLSIRKAAAAPVVAKAACDRFDLSQRRD